LSWAYDGFGNRLSQAVKQGSGPTSVVLVNGNTNRISSSGYSYDVNGNMTQMPKGSGSMTMDYDLSNRLSGVSHPDGTEQYRYAPDNRRVWRSAGRTACYASRGDGGEGYWSGYGEGATEQVIFYSPGGQKIGAYCLSFSGNMQYFAVSASEENVYYGRRLAAKRLIALSINSGTVSDFTADRLQSKGNGSNYYPYGESKTSTAGDDREGFATYTRDEKSGLDYADQRWYASGVGRFGSVDPLQSSMSIADPKSANRYTYVRGNPTNNVDPEGLADYSVTVTGSLADVIPWECDLRYNRFGINSGWARELFGERCGGWATNLLNELNTMRAFEGRGDGGGGAADDSQYSIRVSDFSKEGMHQAAIWNTLSLMGAAFANGIDPDCDSWLGGATSVVGGLLGSTGRIQDSLVGHGILSDGSVNAFVGGNSRTNVPPGTALVVNRRGAFFTSNQTTANGSIAGGTFQARVFILLHEVAHLQSASNFLSDGGNAAAGHSNDELLKVKCKKLIDWSR